MSWIVPPLSAGTKADGARLCAPLEVPLGYVQKKVILTSLVWKPVVVKRSGRGNCR